MIIKTFLPVNEFCQDDFVEKALKHLHPMRIAL